MIFAFLFGLSMDYVFMLTRIRAAYDETGDTDRAIELGLARTGKLVGALRRHAWPLSETEGDAAGIGRAKIYDLLKRLQST